MHTRTLTFAVALAALTACNESGPGPAAVIAVPSAAPVPAAIAAAPVAPLADQWLGQWTGPEGTGLALSKSADGYQINIQSLDGPNSYQGQAVGDRIQFQRNGIAETIRAVSGAETGMKWLADKKDCLVIQQSEGFCRD